MEICDWNLDAYIQRRWWSDVEPHASHFAPIDISEIENLLPVKRIMRDIASGVAFIHLHKEIHRDLKPANGMH
jgi:serine/threonine protein kinase